MKHRIEGKFIEIVVNELTLTVIRDCCGDGTIDYNKPVRKSYLFEGLESSLQICPHRKMGAFFHCRDLKSGYISISSNNEVHHGI